MVFFFVYGRKGKLELAVLVYNMNMIMKSCFLPLLLFINNIRANVMVNDVGLTSRLYTIPSYTEEETHNGDRLIQSHDYEKSYTRRDVNQNLSSFSIDNLDVSSIDTTSDSVAYLESKINSIYKRMDDYQGEIIDEASETDFSSLSNYFANIQESIRMLIGNATLDLENSLVQSLERINLNVTMIDDDISDDLDSSHIPTLEQLYTLPLALEKTLSSIIRSKDDMINSFGSALSRRDELLKEAAEAALIRNDEKMTSLEVNILRIRDEYESSAAKKMESLLMENEMNSKDLHEKCDAWNQKGYITSVSKASENDAISLIKSIPLKSFRYRNDTKKEILVQNGRLGDEMRTRVHIGFPGFSNITDFVDDKLLNEYGDVDSVVVKYYNLIALSHVAKDTDTFSATVKALEDLIEEFETVISEMGNHLQGFENFIDVIMERRIIETQMMVRNLSLSSKKMIHSTKMTTLNSIQALKTDSMKFEDRSHQRINNLRKEMNLDQQLRRKAIEDEIDVILSKLEAVGGLEALLHDITREYKLLVEEFSIELELEKVKIYAEANNERLLEELTLNKIRHIGEEARQTALKLIEVCFIHLSDGLSYILTTNNGRRQVLVAAAVAASFAFFISISRELVLILFSLLRQLFTMPRLVRSWGRRKYIKSFMEKKSYHLSDVILSTEDEDRIKNLCSTIKASNLRNGPLRNILLHGPPGTGKSLAAMVIAETINCLPYAVMSGADIAPLGQLGPSELRKILTWARTQRGIIIIDEAESALGKRVRNAESNSKCSDIGKEADMNASLTAARDALNVFLSLTGNSTGKFMIILTTSNPSLLDDAILDRCDEMIALVCPSYEERKRILIKEFRKRFQQYVISSNDRFCRIMTYTNRFFGKRKSLCYDTAFNVNDAIERLAADQLTSGFSGRQLTMIIRAVETAVYTSDKCILDRDLWDCVIQSICESMKAKSALSSDKFEQENKLCYHKYK